MRSLVVIALLVAGCGRSPGVALTLDATSLSEASRAQVTRLRFSLVGTGAQPIGVPVSGLRAEERVLVQTPKDTTVQLAVDAIDAAGDSIAAAVTDAFFIGTGERVERTLVLGAGALPDLAGVDGFIDVPDAFLAGTDGIPDFGPPALFTPAAQGTVGGGLVHARRIAFADIGSDAIPMMLVAYDNDAAATGKIEFVRNVASLAAPFTGTLAASGLAPGFLFTAASAGGGDDLIVLEGASTSWRYPYDPSTNAFTPPRQDAALVGAQETPLAFWGGLERAHAIGDSWRSTNTNWARITGILSFPSAVGSTVFLNDWLGQLDKYAPTFAPVFAPCNAGASVTGADVAGCAAGDSSCVLSYVFTCNPGAPTGLYARTVPAGNMATPLLTSSAVSGGFDPAGALAVGDFDGGAFDFVYVDRTRRKIMFLLRRPDSTIVPLEGPAVLLSELGGVRFAVGDLDGAPGDEIVAVLPGSAIVLVFTIDPAVPSFKTTTLVASGIAAPPVSVVVEAIYRSTTNYLDIAVLHQDGHVQLWRNPHP